MLILSWFGSFLVTTVRRVFIVSFFALTFGVSDCLAAAVCWTCNLCFLSTWSWLCETRKAACLWASNLRLLSAFSWVSDCLAAVVRWAFKLRLLSACSWLNESRKACSLSAFYWSADSQSLQLFLFSYAEIAKIVQNLNFLEGLYLGELSYIFIIQQAKQRSERHGPDLMNWWNSFII